MTGEQADATARGRSSQDIGAVFVEKLSIYLGIKGRVVLEGPAELIHLNLHRFIRTSCEQSRKFNG